jgi:hypothetical protein
MKDVDQILAEMNAWSPLAEIEAKLRADGHDQTTIDETLALIIVLRKQRAQQIADEPGDVPWRQPS